MVSLEALETGDFNTNFPYSAPYKILFIYLFILFPVHCNSMTVGSSLMQKLEVKILSDSMSL